MVDNVTVITISYQYSSIDVYVEIVWTLFLAELFSSLRILLQIIFDFQNKS